MSPLNLPSHDRFLTVDLYDQKDPAQVLQCIAAFSRRANAVKPHVFPDTIGAKSKGGAMSPQGTGSSQTKSSYTVNSPPKQETPTTFNALNKSAYSGRASPTKPNSLSRGGLASGGPVSSWSKPGDEDKTAPAWNIHQYGYMGGASQGNQGVAFGARRQITSAAPQVPSLAEKEKRLREIEEQKRVNAEEQERARRDAEEHEEAMAREDEERRWAEETRKAKEREEEEQRREEARHSRLQEEENLRKQESDAKARRDQEYESRLTSQRNQNRQVSDSKLNGQFLSQYRASQETGNNSKQISAEEEKIAELERQLAEAREAARRNGRSEEEKQSSIQKSQMTQEQSKPSLPSRAPASQTAHEDDWDASERDYLKKQWQETQKIEAESRREPSSRSTQAQNETPTPVPSRPLPNPAEYKPGTNRTDRYLSSNPAPQAAQTASHRPADYSTTTEVDLENQRRIASQSKTKAGGWASKSLLEREMERERERQREWEENQKEVASRPRDAGEGVGPGQSWE